MRRHFLKPASTLLHMITAGEEFLLRSSAVETSDPHEAALEYIPPDSWLRDWAPPQSGGDADDTPNRIENSPDLSRRTVRSFDPAYDAVANVISAAEEITRTNRNGGRSYPSAGRLYPIEIFIASPGGGAYWLDRRGRATPYPAGSGIWDAVLLSDLSSSMATVATVLAINVPKISRKYLSRGIRYAMMEAGAVGMRLEARLARGAVESFWIGGFDDRKLAQALDASAGARLVPVLIIAHGRPVDGDKP